MKKYTMMILACAFAITAVLSFNFIRLHKIRRTVSLPITDAKKLPLAPNFKLQDLSQNTYELSSNKDKLNVLLVFWTTWCPYCQAELKELNKTYPSFINDGIELLAIDAGERLSEVKKYVLRSGFGFKVLLDTDTAVAKAYDVMGVPTYVLINKSGRIVFKGNRFPKEKYKELIFE